MLRFYYALGMSDSNVTRAENFAELKIEHGGKCSHCPDTNLDHLVFHHLPQFKKSGNVSYILYRHGIKAARKESEKCMLLCVYCHFAVHKRGDNRRVAQPGSASVLGTEGRRFESCFADPFGNKQQVYMTNTVTENPVELDSASQIKLLWSRVDELEKRYNLTSEENSSLRKEFKPVGIPPDLKTGKGMVDPYFIQVSKEDHFLTVAIYGESAGVLQRVFEGRTSAETHFNGLPDSHWSKQISKRKNGYKVVFKPLTNPKRQLKFPTKFIKSNSA